MSTLCSIATLLGITIQTYFSSILETFQPFKNFLWFCRFWKVSLIHFYVLWVTTEFQKCQIRNGLWRSASFQCSQRPWMFGDNIPILLRLTSVIEVNTRALQSLISCWDCKDCTLEGCQRATEMTSRFWGSSFVFMLPFCFITPWEFILLGADFVVEGTCATNCQELLISST